MLALQVLYQHDLCAGDAGGHLRHLLADSEAEPEVGRFARQLFDGCCRHREELDAQITAAADNWAIERMAVVDRNILRLATFELLFLDDVPPKVSINEAIDLAKRFSTADSGAFVNGVLDRIRIEQERAAAANRPSG